MSFCLTLCVAAAGAADNLRFQPGAGGEFEFNTGVLSGKLRAEGKSVGLLPVVHIPSGAILTRSMGFVGHYRVFSTNHRYGAGAWYWPSEAKLLADGSVETHWSAAEDRHFEMWAVYRWAGPATLDVETRVRSQVELPGFESFLASYFSEGFTRSLVWTQDRAASGGKAVLTPAEESRGVWQMFPRNAEVLGLIRDGRWKIEPNPVDWAIQPALAHPVGLRQDGTSGITGVWMAPPEDCFAVATPHQAEGHYSMYLSLFGRTIRAGETAHACARLVITTSPSESEVARLYRAYLKHLRRSHRGFAL